MAMTSPTPSCLETHLVEVSALLLLELAVAIGKPEMKKDHVSIEHPDDFQSNIKVYKEAVVYLDELHRESVMASVVHFELLYAGLVKERPHVLRLESSAVTSGQKFPMLIRVSTTTRKSKSRSNVAAGVLFAQTSRGRLPNAVSNRFSEIQNGEDRADRTGVDVNGEPRVRLERLESRDTSITGDRLHYGVEDSSQSLDSGSAENSAYSGNFENRDGGREEDKGREIVEGSNGGSTTDRVEDRDEANIHRGSSDVAGEGTFSIAESKRRRRSGIRKDLLQRGRSPIELLESMGKCSIELFWTVVNILCLHSRASEALLVFDWWKRQEGYVASEEQYTGFISICGHAQMPHQAQQLFDEMINLDLRPTVATYSCLLQGYAEAGNFQEAKRILAEMRGVGLKPNAITYTGLLYAYGKQGYYSEMAKIFNDMKSYQALQPECAPTSVTYSALLQCYARGGLFARMEKALKEMMTKELDPDGHAVNAMIQGYAQSGLVKDMERSYSLVRPYRVTVKEETLRIVAVAYIRKSYFYQLGTFARYHNRRRVSMGKFIENLLLLSHAANFSMRGLAEEYVRMKETGFEGDITSFNIRALAFSRMQMLWDLRVTILEMVDQGVMPDIVTHGAVVDAYVDGNLKSSLSEALSEMPNLGRVAKVETDELVFEAFGRGDFQKCCEELILESQDIERKFFTYENLVGFYIRRLEILATPKGRKKSSKF